MTAVLMVFTVKVSLARGAASPFEMRIIQRRRADQLTMLKKNYGQRTCCFSSTGKSGMRSRSEILAGTF
jgi:hypothetical protein